MTDAENADFGTGMKRRVRTITARDCLDCGDPVAPSALGPRRRCGDCLAARATAEVEDR